MRAIDLAFASSFALLPAAQEAPGHTAPRAPAVLPLRAQAETVNRLLRDRLDDLLPGLMREVGIDMWIVVSREYDEDPVYLTLVPEPAFAARRTTILVFFDRGEQGVERLTVSRYGLGGFYESAWSGGTADEQWHRLGELVAERDPRRIGVDTSAHWAFGDGLSSGMRARLEQALGGYGERLVPAEALCVRWLETRTAAELEVYPQIVQLARSAVAEAFSNAVITPGVTTTDDVRWWLRERFRELGLPVWFHPMCNVQRRDPEADPDRPLLGASDAVIRRGDVLHTDVGVRYLRLCTDTQEMGYVLRLGEREVPQGLVDALAVGNRWQDMLTSSFVAGRTGNEVLAATLAKSAAAGSRAASTATPSASSATPRGRRSACGTTRARRRCAATGPCTRTPATPSRAACGSGCPSGTARRCRSSSSRTPGSTARRSPTSAAARPAGTSCVDARPLLRQGPQRDPRRQPEGPAAAEIGYSGGVPRAPPDLVP